jgi:hypothetical protein
MAGINAAVIVARGNCAVPGLPGAAGLLSGWNGLRGRRARHFPFGR